MEEGTFIHALVERLAAAMVENFNKMLVVPQPRRLPKLSSPSCSVSLEARLAKTDDPVQSDLEDFTNSKMVKPSNLPATLYF